MITLTFIDSFSKNENDDDVRVVGFVFSSKRLLYNAFHAYLAMNDEGQVINVDGMQILIINSYHCSLIYHHNRHVQAVP
jgi:hypothetical protein